MTTSYGSRILAWGLWSNVISQQWSAKEYVAVSINISPWQNPMRFGFKGLGHLWLGYIIKLPNPGSSGRVKLLDKDMKLYHCSNITLLNLQHILWSCLYDSLWNISVKADKIKMHFQGQSWWDGQTCQWWIRLISKLVRILATTITLSHFLLWVIFSVTFLTFTIYKGGNQWWRDPFMYDTDHIRSYNVKSHWKVQEVNSAPE